MIEELMGPFSLISICFLTAYAQTFLPQRVWQNCQILIIVKEDVTLTFNIPHFFR